MENTSEKTNGSSEKKSLKSVLTEGDYAELKEKLSRRDFLKAGGIALSSGLMVYFMGRMPAFGSSLGAENREQIIKSIKHTDDDLKKNAESYVDTDHLWVYVIDLRKCIGCGKCVRACKIENKVPDNFYRGWIERYVYYSDRDVRVDSPEGGMNGFPPIENTEGIQKAFFVPKICNQCEKPSCVQVCPVGATFLTPDGVVLVDDKTCIGCGYCVQACPYGSRFMNPRTHTADKCTWCYHRLVKGLDPACVEACPRVVRTVVDSKNPDDSDIYKYFTTSTLNVLKPELGTVPKVYYTVLDKEIK